MRVGRSLFGSVASLAVVVTPWLASREVTARTVNSSGDNDGLGSLQRGVRDAAVGSLCQPIVGSGKSAGVPIAIEGSDGQLLTDLTGVAFQLDDGAGTTHDVTEYITTPAEQPIVEGAVVSAYNDVQPGLDDILVAAQMPNSQIEVALSNGLSNPGYYFLGCTSDNTNPATKFAAGMTLKAFRDGNVIASGSVAGRSASYLSLYNLNEDPPSSTIRPITGDHTSVDVLYGGYLDIVPIRFRSLFAQMAILEISNDPVQNIKPCWNDLFTFDGTTWLWNNSGTYFINELTSVDATAWPILSDRTKGLGFADNDTATACTVKSSSEDDFFINRLAAQLLLIDGPAGRVPSLVSGASIGTQNGVSDTFLKPAVRLVAVAPTENNTTTTTAQTSTTATSTTATSTTANGNEPQTAERLPSTGNSSDAAPLVAAFAIGGGIVILVVRRRLARSRMRATS